MCLSPLLIDNPNYKSPIRDPTYHLLHNTKDSKIPVPCGRCQTCIHLRQIYIIQRVQMESISNDLFYGTLTYNQSSLPIVEFPEIKFAYPDFSDWQKMIKMIRKDYPRLKFKYMIVSEYGGKKHRPHFHFILSLPNTSDKLADKLSQAGHLFKIFLQYWRRNYGDNWSPDWKPLCTYVRTPNKYNYDLHYLDPLSSKDGLDGVSFYVTKYILKYDKFVDKFKSKLYFTLSNEDYSTAWRLFRPRVCMSKGFGSPTNRKVISHINKGINFALASKDAFYPYFLSLNNGNTYPLAPYYSKRFLTIKQQLIFISRRPDSIVTEVDIDKFDKQQFNLGLIRSYLSSQSLLVDFDDIDSINEIFDDHDNFNRTSVEGQKSFDPWQDSQFDCPSDCVDSSNLF